MAAGDFVLTVPQMKEAARLYARGLSLRQIADSFGRSQNAVKNALGYLQVPLREKHHARRLRSAPVRTVAHQMQEG